MTFITIIAVAVIWLLICGFIQGNNNMSVTWGKRKLYNPIARTFATAFIMPIAMLGGLLALLVIPFLIITLPVWLPLHILLRALGRQGFIIEEGRSFSIIVGPGGFKQRWR